MTKNRYWRGLVLCGMAAFSFSVLAQESPPASQKPKWGPHIDAAGKFGNLRNLGEADLFIPVTQNANTLIFGDLRGRFDDHSGNEGNLGLGMRHMLPSGWNLGVYGFWDRRRSNTGNLFHQWTLGAEALGQDWDFRVNGYIPQGNRVRSLGTTGGVSTASISGSSVVITTTGLTTSEERALGGYDAEVGWRLPLFAAEDTSQLRLYLGGYRFSDSVAKVSGPRVRAQFAMARVPGLWRGAQLFLNAEAQDDSARGGQQFLGFRLRVPLGGGAEQPRPLNWQERRMTTPVVRDVDIVTETRVTASTPAVVETATTTGGQTITALDSATTTGAALPGAVTAAGANGAVILNGTFNTTATVTMQSGQSLLAGAVPVKSASGHTATLTTSATIATNAAAATVLMANNATLDGVTVNNTYNFIAGNAVTAQGFTGATIRNNTLSAGGSSGSVTVDALSSVNLAISGNTITATSSGVGAAIGIRALGANNLTVSGNTFNMSGTTQYVVAGSNTTVFNTAASTSNATNSGSCYFVGAPTGSVGFSTITCP